VERRLRSATAGATTFWRFGAWLAIKICSQQPEKQPAVSSQQPAEQQQQTAVRRLIICKLFVFDIL
jgi:hypothetical protein